jgi:alpha-tubulin suppressor-like RCC1 family protein
MLATKTDGTLWAWGSNSYSGPLGLNHRDDVSSPTQVPGTWGTSELSICGYNYYTAGVKADGTLWSWGNNGNGQLGQNNTTKRSSPTQVGTDTDWLKLQHSGSYSMGCIKTDGALWVWGENQTGALGQSNTTRYSSPVRIPGSWSQTSSGCHKSFFGIKTDGTLWSGGANIKGALGQNNTTEYSSPKQVGSETTWSTVVGCDEVCFATKTDGTAWSWGFNDKMALGHNQPVNTMISSPTQLPGTSWEIIYAVQNMGMGFQKAG